MGECSLPHRSTLLLISIIQARLVSSGARHPVLDVPHTLLTRAPHQLRKGPAHRLIRRDQEDHEALQHSRPL